VAPDAPNGPLVVALDGPAGAGKSTVGLAVARILGFNFVETGKLYRAVGLMALRAGIAPDDARALVALVGEMKIQYILRAGCPTVFVDGEDVTDELSSPEAAAAASRVSAVPEVRAALLALQRGLARRPGVVVEGRDIGTVVFPRARFKFFLDASLVARARRRARDLAAMGRNATPEEVAADLAARDGRDASRATAPLRRADDAIYVDTSDMTFEQVVDFIVNVVQMGKDQGRAPEEDVAR